MPYVVHILSIFMIFVGGISLYRSVKYKGNGAYFKVKKLKIPFWIITLGVSLFVMSMGIYTLILEGKW
ncbi:hypothetical protein [Bacillus cereus group sp. BfR-BA-01380]|uniref:hypothetical protein n=1 Tax=Bacillus cereus group sp. BfR-BA-01380 TaxID=2920324 RepID=UPI001F57C10A|nr:hypothetical protein [Bacillus cereus group sp. BfR-BA-01380]